MNKVGIKMVEKVLTIKMKGELTAINNFCRDIGELSNNYEEGKYKIDVEFI